MYVCTLIMAHATYYFTYVGKKYQLKIIVVITIIKGQPLQASIRPPRRDEDNNNHHTFITHLLIHSPLLRPWHVIRTPTSHCKK